MMISVFYLDLVFVVIFFEFRVIPCFFFFVWLGVCVKETVSSEDCSKKENTVNVENMQARQNSKTLTKNNFTHHFLHYIFTLVLIASVPLSDIGIK